MCLSSKTLVGIFQVLCACLMVMGCWMYTHPDTFNGLQWQVKNLVSNVSKVIPLQFSFTSHKFETYKGSLASLADIPNIHVKEADCHALFERNGNFENLTKINPPHWHPPDENIEKAATSCNSYIKERQYIVRPVSTEEANFRLAYSILVYQSAHQIEQLLRAIYRPQNFYCIHVDGKASINVFKAVERIAGCFNNVFLSSKRYNVQWGEFSVLQPELTCMEDLWNKTSWRYFINLTGQEFPLKTNWDIVKILKAINGSNAVGFDSRNNEPFAYRTKFHFGRVHQMGRPKSLPPHNMRLAFGSVHVALTRAFVNFTLHHQVAKDFLDWVKDTMIPDETFFQSLNVNPQFGVPGAFTGNTKEPYILHNPFTRYKVWFRCKKGAMIRRNICILGFPYLPDMAKSPDMFANKFLPDFQPLARMCLEELLYNRTREQFQGRGKLNLKPYQSMLYVKQHNPS